MELNAEKLDAVTSKAEELRQMLKETPELSAYLRLTNEIEAEKLNPPEMRHRFRSGEMVFRLYFPSGKTFMTEEFGNKGFAESFSIRKKTIYFAADKTIEIAKYANEDRAFEVLDALVNAYNRKESFTLPVE